MSRTYAVLGSTGKTGLSLLDVLGQRADIQIHAYCRNKKKLLSARPGLQNSKQTTIFEGSLADIELLSSCLRYCVAVFLVIATNDNVPGSHLTQDTATAVITTLERLRGEGARIPKLALLSSASLDEVLSRGTPWFLHQLLLMAASHVYDDLRKAERQLRAQESWLTTIYIKPGALSIDVQRGHALSFTKESSPISYLDLAAGMVEAVDDQEGRYDQRNVSVINTNGPAKFPMAAPAALLLGLLRHLFPYLHTYLPSSS